MENKKLSNKNFDFLKKDIELKAQLFSDDGTKVFNITKTGKENEPEVLGKLAGEEILKQSGKNFIKKR